MARQGWFPTAVRYSWRIVSLRRFQMLPGACCRIFMTVCCLMALPVIFACSGGDNGGGHPPTTQPPPGGQEPTQPPPTTPTTAPPGPAPGSGSGAPSSRFNEGYGFNGLVRTIVMTQDGTRDL